MLDLQLRDFRFSFSAKAEILGLHRRADLF